MTVTAFIILIITLQQGVWYLSGDNLTVAWAKFSALSKTVLLHISIKVP
jgi:hypothetical protein